MTWSRSACARARTCELDDLLARLVEIGYARADLVTARGEIAVRGGIVDVFPPTEEHPLRVEFFGDTIEEIRYFKVADQRSIGRADDGLWAPPCRELLLTPAVRDRAKELADTHPALADILGKLAEGIPVEGMEAFAPVLADRMDLLRRLRAGGRPRAGLRPGADPDPRRGTGPDQPGVPRGVLGQRRGRRRGAHRSRALGLPADRAGPRGRGRAGPALVDDRAVRRDRREPESRASTPGSAIGETGAGDRVPFRINASLSPAYRGDAARMLTDVRRWLAEDWRVVLVTEGHGPAQRLAEMLRGEGIGARLQDLDDAPEAGVPYVTTALIENGFVWPAIKLALLTESDLAGHPAGLPTTRDMRRMPSRRRGGVDPLQLQAGDYVVHEQHGVGRYVEMTSRTAAGATREYLVIEYAPGAAGAAAGPALRAHRPAGRGDQVLRWRGPDAAPARRGGLGQGQGPGAQGRPADRLRADPAVLGADGLARVRVRAGHSVAARAGGRVPLRGDPGPARRPSTRSRRHGAAGADGPADLR